MRITEAEAVRKGWIKPEDKVLKPSKHGNKRIEVDGKKFDSKGEYVRYSALQHLERLGFISKLKLKPVYLLQEGFTRKGKYYRPITYTPDYEYIDLDLCKQVIEDFKGNQTEASKRTIKQFIFIHNPEVFRISTAKGYVDL